MIHVSKLNEITERKDGSGVPVPFSFKAVTKDGRIIEGENCVVTSSNFHNRTRNVDFLDSGEIRKVRNIAFLSINDVEITL